MDYLNFFKREITSSLGAFKTITKSITSFSEADEIIPMAIYLCRFLYQGDGCYDISWKEFQESDWKKIKETPVKKGMPMTPLRWEQRPALDKYKEGIHWRFWESLENQFSYWEFIVQDNGIHLQASFKFDPTFVRLDMMENLLENFMNQIRQIKDRTHESIFPELSSLSDLDRTRQFTVGTGPENKYKLGHIVKEFQKIVQKFPDSLALMDKNQEFTYAQLDEKSSAVAAFLEQNQIFPNSRIVLALKRNSWFLIWVLGIFKAGCTYIAVEPGYPEERIRYILKDTEAKAIISNTNSYEFVASSTSVFRIEELNHQLGKADEDFKPKLTENLAYILYTSGSTGTPKGVMVNHKNLSHFVSWCIEYNPMMPQDISISLSPFVFDVSICELFTPLFQGATLYIMEKHSDLLNISNKFKDIAMICTVPSAFKSILALRGMLSDEWDRFSSLKYLNMAGEELDKALADKLLTQIQPQELRNCYGPTETSVYATWDRILLKDSKISIGKPLPGVRTYVLSENQALVPYGFPGELAIGGAGVTEGYLNNPTQTNKHFVVISSVPNERVYLTGDIVRLDENGNLIFYSRKDHQIKLNGYRIEIGEIESHLNCLKNIDQAIVFPLEKKGKGKILVACYTGAVLQNKEIINKLKEYLPDYMIPQGYYHLENFPITFSGKIDRKQTISNIVNIQNKSGFFGELNMVLNRLKLN